MSGDVAHGVGHLRLCKLHHDSAFHYAIRSNDLALVSLFLSKLDKEKTLQSEDLLGWSPLTLACIKGTYEMVELLLSSGADVMFETSRGRVALSECCRRNNLQFIRLLLSHRASLTRPNRLGMSPLRLVEEYCSDEIQLECRKVCRLSIVDLWCILPYS